MAAKTGSLWRASSAVGWRLARPSRPPATILRGRDPRRAGPQSYATMSEVLSGTGSSKPTPQMRAGPSPTSSRAASERSVDSEEVTKGNTFGRNERFRSIYKARDFETMAAVQKKLKSSPFVPNMRTYPSEVSRNISAEEATKAARVQVAQDRIWEHHNQNTPSLKDILDIMRQMSSRKEEAPKVEAMRVLLPDKVDLALPSRRLEYVESATGLLAKLSVSVDHPNPDRGIILRGRGPLLARAADEMIQYNRDIKVFRLGNVTTFDYDTRQLWPNPEYDEAAKASMKPKKATLDSEDTIWMHREVNVETIDYPYEKTPKPSEWNKQTFHKYITTLISKRLKTNLITRFYDKATDTDGVRIGLIMAAFEDPKLRHCITPHILNQALSFMMWRGGHRATAEELFRHAQQWGIPIDTTTFNIMLGGYVTIRSTAHFYRILRKMRDDFYAPNTRTWLHVLKLVERDDARRSIIVSMYDHGAFNDPAARREIAKIMAPHDLHVALRTSQSLTQFSRDQAERYGEDWFTTGALVHLVDEFLMFYDDATGADHAKFQELQLLFERQPADGMISYNKPILAMIKAAARRRNWELALWALELHSKLGCTPDKELYTTLIDLAVETESPHALGALLIHGTVTDMLSWPSRRKLQRCLLGKHPSRFWRLIRLHCFDSAMTNYLEAKNWRAARHPIEVVEDAIKQSTGSAAVPMEKVGVVVAREYREHDVPWKKAWEEREEGGKIPDLKALRMEFRVGMKLNKWIDTRGEER